MTITPYTTSKLIHGFHLISILVVVIIFIAYTTFVQFVLFSVVFVNLFHPSHGCILTLLENKFREKAGLPPIKWFKFYILSGKPFRKD